MQLYKEQYVRALMHEVALTIWDEAPMQHRFGPEAVDRCIAVKSSVLQGMIVCFDKEVVWCVGVAVILRGVGRVWSKKANGRRD